MNVLKEAYEIFKQPIDFVKVTAFSIEFIRLLCEELDNCTIDQAGPLGVVRLKESLSVVAESQVTNSFVFSGVGITPREKEAVLQLSALMLYIAIEEQLTSKQRNQ